MPFHCRQSMLLVKQESQRQSQDFRLTLRQYCWRTEKELSLQLKNVSFIYTICTLFFIPWGYWVFIDLNVNIVGFFVVEAVQVVPLNHYIWSLILFLVLNPPSFKILFFTYWFLSFRESLFKLALRYWVQWNSERDHTFVICFFFNKAVILP